MFCRTHIAVLLAVFATGWAAEICGSIYNSGTLHFAGGVLVAAPATWFTAWIVSYRVMKGVMLETYRNWLKKHVAELRVAEVSTRTEGGTRIKVVHIPPTR